MVLTSLISAALRGSWLWLALRCKDAACARKTTVKLAEAGLCARGSGRASSTTHAELPRGSLSCSGVSCKRHLKEQELADWKFGVAVLAGCAPMTFTLDQCEGSLSGRPGSGPSPAAPLRWLVGSPEGCGRPPAHKLALKQTRPDALPFGGCLALRVPKKT